MNLDSLVLQEYVATANNPEYKGDYDIINSKFPEFENVDPVVLQEYVLTANNPEYKNDYNIINGKFPEFFTEETVETIDPPKIESPYLQNREFGKFLTGRGMPVEVDDLTIEEREVSSKIIADIEKEEDKSNKNLVELQSYDYIPIPGDEYSFKDPKLGLSDGVMARIPLNDQNLPIYGYQPNYLDNRYTSLLEKDKKGNFQMMEGTGKKENFRAEWIQTNEGQSWAEQNWFKNLSSFDTGWVEDTEELGGVSNLVKTGIRRGGEINDTKALNNEIGTILNNNNVKYPLPEGYTLDPGIIEEAKENVNLKNAATLSDFYGIKEVGQVGFHQREIIRISSQSDLLNPYDFNFKEDLSKNLERIKYHEGEINKVRNNYFAEHYDEDGTPKKWYDLLSGEMVEKSKATSTQLADENRNIANASKKWGDTNVEVLYSKENDLINQVVYLAKKAYEEAGTIKAGTDFPTFETLTAKQQEAFIKQASSNFLVSGLSTLPGESKIANEFNTKLAELVQIQKAIVLNYKPTDLKKTDNFFDYASQIPAALMQQVNPFKISSGILSDNEDGTTTQRLPSGVFTESPDNVLEKLYFYGGAVDKDIEKAKEALTFIKFTEDQVGEKKTKELAEYWDPGFNKGSAQAIMEGVKIAVEFGITRKIAGGAVERLGEISRNIGSKISNYLVGESRIANAFNNTVATIVEEAALIEANNKLIREPIGEERFDPRFAIGLGIGSGLVKGVSNTLLKAQRYRNLITTLSEAPVFENLVRGTVQPTVQSFVILSGSLGEISLQKNQSLKKSFDDLTAEDGFLQHMFSTFIMVKSAGLANPVKGITNIIAAGEQAIIAKKGGLNKRAVEASKILDLSKELKETNEDGTKPLTESQINEKAFNMIRQEGLHKDLLTEKQQARKKQIKEAAGTLKTQIDFNNTVKEIKSNYGKNEYANIFTMGRRLQNGQSPTAEQALTLANMASLDQVFSIIKDPQGSFSENKRQEKVFTDYVQQVKAFVEGVRKIGGTANDPKKEIKLLKKWNQYNELVLAPLNNLNTYLDNNEVKGPEKDRIKKQISKLEIKQQEYFDQLNLELQESTAERRQKIRQKVREIVGKQKNIKYTTLNDIEFAEKFGEKNTEGLFINESGEIFVNETYANEINNVSVDSHELLHPTMNVTLNKLALDGRLKPFIIDFKKSLPANVLAEAQRIIDERTDITDKEFTREWFNVVSDALQSGKIKVTNTRSSMQKLADTFTEFFKTETPMEDVDFETGKEAYEFIKRYSDVFREGKSDAPLEEAVVSKLKRFETTQGEEGTVKDSQIPVEKETFTIDRDGRTGKVEVVTNKDGSRTFREIVEDAGDTGMNVPINVARVGKENTLSNQQYVEGAYADVVGESTVVKGTENISPKISKKIQKSSTPRVDEKTGNIFLDLTLNKNQKILDEVIGEKNKEGYYEMPKSNWKNSEAETLAKKLIDGGSFDKLIGAKVFTKDPNKRQEIVEESREELKKHVERFDPQLNKNLFGYINSYLGRKVGTASKTKSIETSSLDQRQELMGREGAEIASGDMTAEELTDISLEKDRQAKAKEQEPKETTASKIGMPKEAKTPSGKVESNEYIEKVVNEIKFKDLKDITTEPGPNQTISPFLSNLKAKVATDGNVKKDISQGMGKNTKEKVKYIETNFEKLAKSLDPTYFSGLIEREISKGKKVTLPKGLIQKDIGSGYTSDWYGKKAVGTKAAKTGITSGLKRIRLNPDFNFKNKANAKIFADAFKSQGRYEGLAGQIGAKAVIDVVEKSLGTGNKVDTKIKDIYEIQGRDLPADYAKNFKDQILRSGVERSSTKKPEEIKIDLKDVKINFKAGEGFANSLKGIKEAISGLVVPKEIDSKGNVTDIDGQNRLRYFLENILPKFLQTSKLINSANLSNRKSGAKMWLNSELREITEKAARITIEGDKGKLTAEALKELNKKIKALENSLGGSGLGGSTPKGFSGMKGAGKNFSKDSFIKRVDENYEGLDYFIDQTFEMINKHPEYLGEYLAFMKGASTSSTHFWRNFSMVIGKESNWNFDGLKGRGEHVLVSNEAAEFMTKAILKNLSTSKSPNKVIKTAKELLKENFFQILISVSNDLKVTKAGFQNSMPDGFWESWDKALETGNISDAWSVWSRYFNSKVNKQIGPNGEAGFNPNEIKLYDRASKKQKSLADMLEIGEEQFGKDVLNPEVVAEQQLLIEKWSTRQDGFKTSKELREQMATQLDMLNAKRDAALKSMSEMEIVNKDFKTPEKYTNKMVVDKAAAFDKALDIARSFNAPIKKIRIFDFDDTIAKSKSKVLYETLEGKKGKLTPEQYARDSEKLIEEGATFDFSEFDKVIKGKKGPLFDLMKKMNEAKGERDIFILTARPAASALSIQKFLKELGIEIPLKNITGLENGSPFAKSDWIVGKAAEGYNDFFFADDAVSNVKAVRDALEVLDVKSKTQIAKMERSSTMSEDFNKIIEESTGIGAEKVFSDVKAKLRGGKKKGQRFFIPPSAEDMLGLVYTTLGKGKKGEAHMKFYQENFFDPYTRAMDNLSTDRVNLMADFKALKKELDVPKDLQKITESGFTNEQAVRVYLWNKAGEKIPGLSKTDLKELNDIVEKDFKLQVFADQIMSITKGDGYSKPKEAWAVGTITTDLIDVLNTKKRSKYLQTWNQNVDQIYSKDNLNKLEAAYGRKYRDAVENSLERMKSGSNRLKGGNKLSNDVLDYINNSTAVTMFVNVRSALLQTISAANFINWSFNNPLRAGKAFANQPQYWKDFIKLMNSDYLVDRRNGLKLNINESEIANAAKTSKNKAKAALNYILEKGYLPTKFADSFAIASGGATFYRNRINDLIKNEGLSKSEAEIRAMKEFRAESEKSQQSSDPSKISSQQASYLGRVILQYVNTPMQYARLQKRDIQDMANRRAMPGKTLAQSNRIRLSRITYYAFVQNLIFNALQQAVFAVGFGDDELSDTDEKRLVKTANGMLDSSLRGLGLGGVTIQVLKNLGIDIYDRSKRARPEYTDSYKKLLEFSPAIKSKLGKFESAAYPFDSKKRRAEVFEKGFSLDNPAYESMAKVITATTNVPLDRVFKKANNLKTAASEDAEAWQSIAMILGWPEWQLRTDDTTKKEDSKNKKSKTSLINKSNKAKTSNRKTIKRKTR